MTAGRRTETISELSFSPYPCIESGYHSSSSNSSQPGKSQPWPGKSRTVVSGRIRLRSHLKNHDC